MTVTPTLLESGSDTTNQAVYATASYTPPANKPIYLVAASFDVGGDKTPAPTGNGLTWVEISNASPSTSTNYGVFVFRALGASPSTGAVTITYPESVGVCLWAIVSFDGADISGTNGSGSVVESQIGGNNAATALQVDLTDVVAGNATFGAFVLSLSETISPGTGYTALRQDTQLNPNAALLVEFRSDGQTAVGCSWTSSGGAGGVAIEISAGAADLTVADAAQAHTVDSVALTQDHQLAAVDAGHGQAVESPTLTQLHNLVVDDARHGQASDSLVLELGAISLVVADAAHGQDAAETSLTQQHQLAVADAMQPQAADGVALTQAHQLLVSDTNQPQLCETPALTQTHLLTVADTAQGHTAESPAVNSSATLAVAPASHAQSADDPTLTQLHTLTVAAATHQQAADSVAVAQIHSLAVQDAIHQQLAESPAVVDPFGFDPVRDGVLTVQTNSVTASVRSTAASAATRSNLATAGT